MYDVRPPTPICTTNSTAMECIIPPPPQLGYLMLDEEPGERILSPPSSFQWQDAPILGRIPGLIGPSPFASSYRVSTLHARCHQPSPDGYGVSIRSLPCLQISIRRSSFLTVFWHRSFVCVRGY